MKRHKRSLIITMICGIGRYFFQRIYKNAPTSHIDCVYVFLFIELEFKLLLIQYAFKYWDICLSCWTLGKWIFSNGSDYYMLLFFFLSLFNCQPIFSNLCSPNKNCKTKCILVYTNKYVVCSSLGVYWDAFTYCC